MQIVSASTQHLKFCVRVILMMQSTSIRDVVVGMSKIAVYVCWGGVLDDGVSGIMSLWVEELKVCVYHRAWEMVTF